MSRGGMFQAGRDDFSVGGKVDELGLVELGVVVQQVDSWLLGCLTTLSRNGCVRGNGLLPIRKHKWVC
jgi:hypothetical protein